MSVVDKMSRFKSGGLERIEWIDDADTMFCQRLRQRDARMMVRRVAVGDLEACGHG